MVHLMFVAAHHPLLDSLRLAVPQAKAVPVLVVVDQQLLNQPRAQILLGTHQRERPESSQETLILAGRHMTSSKIQAM